MDFFIYSKLVERGMIWNKPSDREQAPYGINEFDNAMNTQKENKQCS